MDDLLRQVQNLIPKNLDGIVRTNRHLCEIRLPTDAEVATLSGYVRPGTPKLAFGAWWLVAIDTRDRGLDVVIAGAGAADGRSHATSPVTAIDLGAGYARTSNSLYRLDGDRAAGEPNTDALIMMCVMLRQWGWGKALGIPAFSY